MKTKAPYQLPRPLTIDETKISGGVTMDIVKEYIRYHDAYMRRYIYLENLYKGFHDVFKAPEKEEWKPDHRLAVNFPRYITDTFSGYAYGIPIKVSSEDNKLDEAIQDFQNANEITDHDSEMIKNVLIYGHAFEYIYQNEQAETKITECTPKEVFCVYDDTMEQHALFAVRFGRHSTNSRAPGQKYGEILTRETIQYFDGDEIKETIVNPYGLIPIVEWRANSERMGLYEPVAGLIEEYNHTLGEKANDVDAFADAYLAILGAEVDEEDVYHIRDDRLINLYGTDNAHDVLVQFLSKPTADGTQENLLNRLETLIYQTSMVANISDETFGNATSGTALAYKLQAMSNLALTFDRKIEKSLKKRYKIFCSLPTNAANADGYRDLKIQTSRNIPKNIQEEAQTAQTLGGIVSQKTQLSVLSIVPDVDAEIKQIDKEKQDSQDQAIKRIYPGNTQEEQSQEEQQKESQEGGLNEQS